MALIALEQEKQCDFALITRESNQLAWPTNGLADTCSHLLLVFYNNIILIKAYFNWKGCRC